MPRRISLREPITPTSFPAVSDTIIRLMLYGNRRNPASVGEKPRTFCMYCVITSNIPYAANKTTKIVMIVERRLAGRRGPRLRRRPGRSTRDQSMFPQSPRPGPFLTWPC